MEYKIIYTADLHGNITQYKKLVNYSRKVKADAIIIGGDITPKESPKDYIKNQRSFLENIFPELLKPLKKETRLFLMMGNDDCACNLDVLEKLEETNFSLCRLINQKRMSLVNDFDIVGYPYVPITPFKIKDWEKFDLSYVPNEFLVDYYRLKKDYDLDGFKSENGRWKKFYFSPETENYDSIQADLYSSLFSKKPNKTVYVMHSPPYKTNLDMVSRGHVGSIAIRLFIEKNQPYLTLHSHIHETVDISGNFKDKIGNTLCMSCGNDPYGKLALLEFDLYNPDKAKRIII